MTSATDNRMTELEQSKYEPPYDARPMRMLRHHIEYDCLATRRGVLREIEDLFAIELKERDKRIAELEQAIAATLGNGTLTAEQVREAIERHSAWVIGNNRCFHDGAYEAIANELNAMLGGRECEPTEEYACSACGQDLVAYDVGVGANGGAIELDPPILFNYCPNCGRRVSA